MASSTRVQPVVLPTSTNSQHNHIQNLNPNETLPPQQQQNPVINNNNHHTNYNSHPIDLNNNGANPKKRSLEQDYVTENTPYYKMRATLKDLRPLVIEALKDPHFKTCQAGRVIQEKLKLMVDLCRQQTISLINCHSVSGSRDVASLRQGESKPSLLQREIKFTDRVIQEKRFRVGNNSEKQTPENYKMPGCYIVGGSAFGWNFLMFHGTKPEYYGRTKESFRAEQ